MIKARHLSFVALLGCLAGAASASLSPKPALAAVSIEHTLAELVDAAPWVAVVRIGEQESRWEVVGGTKRIVTYTAVTVDERVVGAPPSTLRVRTLGGVVGKIGQRVGGQPIFTPGRRALVFLGRNADGVPIVIGAAQGHFPVKPPPPPEREDAPPPPARLGISPAIGKLVARPGPRVSIQQSLVGRSLDDANREIRRVRRELEDARKRR